MSEIKSTHQREVIYNLLKEKFQNYVFWRVIESDLAILCSALPEVIDEKKKKDMIDGLKKIKEYLTGDKAKIDKNDLKFLDEEIERFDKTISVSLYEEQEDKIDLDLIEKYAALGFGTHGVVKTHIGFSYPQLRFLTNGVYQRSGLLKFYISPEKTISGKIMAEIYDYVQDIPIVTLAERIKQNEAGEYDKEVFLFGEKYNHKDFKIIKEVAMPFRAYRFITEKNKQLILLSKEKLEVGDYLVSGVITQVTDYKILSDTAKLPTKLPYMFVHSIQGKIIKFSDTAEFNERLRFLGVNKSNMFNFPFLVKNNKEKRFILKHPRWFKWLVWSWLTHSRVGMSNPYPMHIFMAGPAGSGKSWLLNRLHELSKEVKDVFSGSSSTLKNLMVSFKYKPAKLGYLAESSRFSFCDEFLRCMMGRGSGDSQTKEESVALLNDLLEHQKREAGSGVSSVEINMTSRVLATTNPLRGIKSVEDLAHQLDKSFLSRWLIYYQKEDGEHVQMIRNAKEEDLKEHGWGISDNEFIALIDYLHTIKAKFDKKKMEELLDKPKPMLSENLRSLYDSRSRHHLECLIDGIVKTRCMFEHDMAFSAQEKDYEMAEEIWDEVIGSWIDAKMIKNLPVNKRINYLPADAQFLFDEICKAKRPLNRFEVEDIALKSMKKNEYREAHIILRDNGLILETGEGVKPFYMEE